jgi:hypothetical protein
MYNENINSNKIQSLFVIDSQLRHFSEMFLELFLHFFTLGPKV